MAREKVKIFEVGPRDGLQNEAKLISARQKLDFISGLIDSGLRDLEVGSFVRPDRIPQMADTDEIFKKIHSDKIRLKGARLWSLVPNRVGLARALKVGSTHLAVFTAATESFAKRNIGMSIRDSIIEFQKVILEGKKRLGRELKIRGYISTAFGCPFEGWVTPKKTLRVMEMLLNLGVDQISIGDTIGVATPNQITDVMKSALKMAGQKKVALHVHDTRGTALANALRALELGIRVFDSSAGGLGGCPFAPGAAGNLATEDLVYMLQGMGFDTGIDLNRLCEVNLKLSKIMNRKITSRYLAAYFSRGRGGYQVART